MGVCKSKPSEPEPEQIIEPERINLDELPGGVSVSYKLFKKLGPLNLDHPLFNPDLDIPVLTLYFKEENADADDLSELLKIPFVKAQLNRKVKWLTDKTSEEPLFTPL